MDFILFLCSMRAFFMRFLDTAKPKVTVQVAFGRKLDTCCQAMRHSVKYNRITAPASKRHFKWAVIIAGHTAVWTVTVRIRPVS